MTKKRFLIICSVVIAIAMLIPVKIRTIPALSLQCVDRIGAPVAGPEIFRDSAFFGFGERHTDREVCGSDGFVRFNERHFVSPIVVGAILISVDSLNEIVSPHGALAGGYAIVWSKGHPNSDLIWVVPGRESPTRIRVLAPTNSAR